MSSQDNIGNKGIYQCNIPQDCCGNVISWKMNATTRVAIPSNSRPNPTPSSGTGTTQDGGKWSNYGVDPNLYIGGAGFICRRNGRTTCGGKTGGFAPNPIRHWRKQLFPRQGDSVSQGGCVGKSRVSAIQDRPGCAVTLTGDTINSYVGNYTEFYINQTSANASCEKLDDYCFIKNMRKRSRPLTVYSKEYHSSSQTYLQSRGRLFRQQSSINFKKMKNFPCITSTPPPNYPGLYNTDISGCFYDNSCVLTVVYNPNNSTFATNGAVAGSLYTRNRTRISLTNNQYNIINRWGLDGVSTNKIYPRVLGPHGGYVKYTGGTGHKEVCCPVYVPIPYWDGSGVFIYDLPDIAADAIFEYVNASGLSIYNAFPIRIKGKLIDVGGNYEPYNPADNITSYKIEKNYRPNTPYAQPTGRTRITLNWKYNSGDNSSYGFTLVFLARLIGSNESAGSGAPILIPDAYPLELNIIQWGGIPLSLELYWQYFADRWNIIGPNTFSYGNLANLTSGPGTESWEREGDDTGWYPQPTDAWTGCNNAITLTNAGLPLNQQNPIPTIDTPRILEQRNPATTDISGGGAVHGLQGLFIGNSNKISVCYGNINEWDISGITSTFMMFENNYYFNVNLNKWNMSSVTSMHRMFKYCESFTGKGLNNWIFSSNIDLMYEMFEGCINFNANVEQWAISSYILRGDRIFQECTKFQGKGIENWTWNIQNMTSIFQDCLVFNPTTDITWDISLTYNGEGMFQNCPLFEGKGLRNWNPVSLGLGSNKNVMKNMFIGCTSFNQNLMNWEFPNINSTSINDNDVANMFNSSGIDVINMTWTLVGWGKHIYDNSASYYEQLGMDNITYYTDKYGANNLKTIHNWTFSIGTIETHVVPSYLGEQDGSSNLTNWSGAYYDNSGTTNYGIYPQDICGDSIVGGTDFSLWASDASMVTDMSGMFIKCSNWNGSGVEKWKTDSITNSSFMFQDCTTFIEDLSNWTINNVTTTESMFQRCYYWPGTGLEYWNVSQLTNAKNMFDMLGVQQYITSNYQNGPPWNGPPNIDNSNQITQITSIFNPASLSGWNVSNVTNFENTFRYCQLFDGSGLDAWNTKNVQITKQMFQNCTVFNTDVTNWNTVNLVNADKMFNYTMFDQNVGSWDIQSLQSASGAFDDCSLSNQNYTDILVGWGYQNSIKNNGWLGALSPTGCYYYYEAIVPRAILTNNYKWTIYDRGPWPPAPPALLDLSNWSGMFIDNVGQTTNDLTQPYPAPIPGLQLTSNSSFFHYDSSMVYDMSGTFINSDVIIGYGIETWDVRKVQTFDYMLKGCFNFNQDLSQWQTISGNSFKETFMDCSGWNGAGSETLDVSSATTIEGIFDGCHLHNDDLTGWSGDVNSVTDYIRVFNDCRTFTGLGLDTWTTNSAQTFHSTFNNCDAFNQDLSTWTMTDVSDITIMFSNCKIFEGIGLSNWDTSSLIDMSAAFINCLAFNTDLNWSPSNCTIMTNAFMDCPVFNGNVTAWDVGSATNMNGMFKNCTSFDQDLSGWNIASLTDATGMLDGCGMSTQNFTLLVRYWADVVGIQSNVNLTAPGFEYYQWACKNPSSPTEFYLVANKFWTPTKIDNYHAGFDASLNTLQIGFPPSIYALNDWSDMFLRGIGDENYPSQSQFSDIKKYIINTVSDFSIWDTAHVVNMSNMFWVNYDQYRAPYAYLFEGTGLQLWDLSSCIAIGSFLEGCNHFQQDLSNWNVTNIQTFASTFKDCSGWDGDGTSYWRPIKSTNMSNMFQNCINFEQDLSGWSTDISFVTLTLSMFQDCSAFTGQGLSSWKTESVTDMAGMLKNCINFNQDLGGWNISSLTTAENMLDYTNISTTNFSNLLEGWANQAPSIQYNVTLGAEGLTYNNSAAEYYEILTSPIVEGGYNWTIGGSAGPFPMPPSIGNLTNWSFMFWGGIGNSYIPTNPAYSAITGVKIYSTTDFSEWNSSNVTNFESMFQDCITWFGTGVDVWDVSNAVIMIEMFRGCTAFNQDLSTWKVDKVDTLANMFMDCSSFVGTGLPLWDLPLVTCTCDLFTNCKSFDQDLSVWNISNLNDATGMFDYSGLSSQNYSLLLQGWADQAPDILPGVPLGAADITYFPWAQAARDILTGPPYNWVITDDGSNNSQPGFPPSIADLSNWSFMFYGGVGNAYAQNPDYIDISGYVVTAASDFTKWDPDISPAVENMEGMFGDCSGFAGIGLETWNITSVTDLSGMFTDCSNLTVDLSGWNTSGVETMNSMFKGCTNFTSNLTYWNVESVIDASGMLDDCSMSHQDYSTLLWYWSEQSVQDNVYFGAQGLQYYPWPNLLTRKYTGLIADHTWTIYDGSGVGATMADVSQCGFPPSIAALWYWGGLSSRVAGWTGPEVGMFQGGIGNELAQHEPFIDISGYVVGAWSDFGNWNTKDGGGAPHYVPISKSPGTMLWSGGVLMFFRMFKDCTTFEGRGLDKWTIDSAQQLQGILYNCPAFNQDLSNWNIGKIWGWAEVFQGCTTFTGSGLENWKFTYGYSGPVGGQPDGFWENDGGAPLTIQFNYTFDGCSVFNPNLGSWDVRTLSWFRYIFTGCSAFTGEGMQYWKTYGLTNGKGMVSGSGVNQNLGNWYLAKCTGGFTDNGMNGSFSPQNYSLTIIGWASAPTILNNLDGGASSQEYYSWAAYARDILAVDNIWTNVGSLYGGVQIGFPPSIEALTDWSYMFDGGIGSITNTNYVDISGYAVVAASDFTIELDSTPNWDPSGNVTNLEGMFRNAILFNSDIGGWNVSTVINTISMLEGCTTFDQDLSSWVPNAGLTAVNIVNMFNGATVFNNGVSGSANSNLLRTAWLAYFTAGELDAAQIY